jgi:hypothetical protein
MPLAFDVFTLLSSVINKPCQKKIGGVLHKHGINVNEERSRWPHPSIAAPISTQVLSEPVMENEKKVIDETVIQEMEIEQS